MNKYPSYPLGFAQFIGSDFIDDMAFESVYTKCPDVLLGIISHKLNITILNEPNVWLYAL